MRLFLILFFITSLFACDTSSNIKAYQDYRNAKQIYVNSILHNNHSKKIVSLEEIIKCGNFLGFDVSKYEIRLKQLNKHQIKQVVKRPKFQNPLNIESDYIRILSTNPIKLKLSHRMKIKFFTLYKNRKYYKIFDIYNAKISKFFLKKIEHNRFLKIAQNDKNKVRVVIYSRTKFKVKYYRGSELKILFLDKKKVKEIKHIKEVKHNIYRNQKTYKQIKKSRIIVIDAGHGGKDPGGVGYHHIKEKNIVLPIGKYLKEELNKRGYRVYLTRYRDKFITLKNRTKFANRKKADLFISLHCNIAPHHSEVHGIETYFLSPARSKRAKNVAKLENSAIGNLRTATQNIVLNFLNKNKIIDSTKLALDIQKSLIYNLRKHYKGIKDGGVRPAPFWVLVGSSMPAILIETGFISNKNEALKLINRTYQKRYAKYIADGIDSYFRKNR